MNVPEFFKNFKLDTWYKAVLYLGAITLVLSLFLDVKGITNRQLLLISGGSFLIGLGEWKNHKTQSFIKPPNVYTGPTALITKTSWSPDFIGLLLDLLGILLIILGVRSIVVTSQFLSTLCTISTATPSVHQTTLLPTSQV